MSRKQQVQCLLFIVKKRGQQDNKQFQSSSSSVPSAVEGYALLSDVFKANQPAVIEQFCRNNIRMINNELSSRLSFGAEDELQVIEVLLDEAPSAAVDIDTLSLTVENADKEVVRILLRDTSIQFETECDSADVCRAVDNSNLDTVRRFLTCGANIEGIRGSAESLLHIGARRGPESLVGLALEHGAHVEVRRNYATALHVAAGSGLASIVKLLIKNGANINAGNDRGRTPLFNAARAGHVNLMRVLADCGARVDVKDSNHSTVLDVVCEGRPQPTVFQHILDWYFSDLEGLSKASISSVHCARRGYSDDVFIVDMADIQVRKFIVKNYALLFVRHLIKIIVADSNADLSEVNLSSFWRRKIVDFVSLRKKFEVEVAQMKSETVADTSIPFYDILTKGAVKVGCYLRNNSVSKVLTWDNLHSKYPLYASFLFCKIQKGMLREQLLKEGIGICRILLPQFSKLPREIKEKIINYLSTPDISLLKIACLSTNTNT